MKRILCGTRQGLARSLVALAQRMQTRGAAVAAHAGASGSAAGRPMLASAEPPVRRRLHGSGVRPLALEQRFMFDGAAAGAVVDAAQPVDAVPATGAPAWLAGAAPAAHPDPQRGETNHADRTDPSSFDARQLAAGDPAANGGRSEVVFIEDDLDGYETLAAGVKPGAEVALLDSRGDGLQQMARYLAGRQGIDAIHVISHGAEAQLNLGSLTLDTSGLHARAADLAAIGSVLGADGDLLLYGCSVAGGEGQAFVSAIAQATGADVAASTDLTGAEALGGDWSLEATTGAVQADAALSQPALAAYPSLLAAATLTAGNDTPALSAGDDTITADSANALNADDVIDGQAGADTLQISAAQTVAFNATTLTNVEAITITAGDQNITTHDATVGAGRTLTVDASASAGRLTWNAAAETDGTFDISGGAGNDSVVGGAGDDTLRGGGANDTLSGGNGIDLLYGDAGNDTLYGGNGTDTLSGGDGNDFLYGQADDDVLYGGAGNDGISGGDGNDTVYGGIGNDTLIGSNGNDTLYGEDGNDWIWGQNNDDLIFGGAGSDTISGDAGNDTVYGGDGNDTISGSAGDDTIYGGDGDDSMRGGTGADRLYGSAGNDTFSGTAAELNGDTIEDFAAGDSILIIGANLSALNGSAASGTIDLGGGQTLGLNGISGASGNFSAVYSGANTTITLIANQSPAITSAAAVNAAENQTAAGTVTATDPDGDTVAYSISGGADQARFSIDAATGVLRFVAAPDFESPADSDADNTYVVDVTASDGRGASAVQTISVTVTNVNENPAISSAAAVNAAENQTAAGTVTAADPDGDVLAYSISGGADQARFSIDAATGVLRFVAAPDFESPADSDADNTYVVDVTASDGRGGSAVQTISVTVDDVAESAAPPQARRLPPTFQPPPQVFPVEPMAEAQVPPDTAPLAPTEWSFIRHAPELTRSLAAEGLAQPASSWSAWLPAGHAFAAPMAATRDAGGPVMSSPDLGTAAVRLGREWSFALPDRLVAHADGAAAVTLEARLSDGSPLPPWLKFDARTGVLSGRPPADLAGRLNLVIIARDPAGREATTRLVLEFDGGKTASDGAGSAWADARSQQPAAQPHERATQPHEPAPQPLARAGLSDQLRQAETRTALAPRLADLARSVQAARDRA